MLAEIGLTYSTALPVALAGVAVCAYLLGCFNGAVIVSKYILRDDVRNHGSGNAGLTNFYRTFGGFLTFVVILCDVLKAVLAVEVGSMAAGMSSTGVTMAAHRRASGGRSYCKYTAFP